MDDLIQQLKEIDQGDIDPNHANEVAKVVAEALERIDARLKAMEQSVRENDARHATF